MLLYSNLCRRNHCFCLFLGITIKESGGIIGTSFHKSFKRFRKFCNFAMVVKDMLNSFAIYHWSMILPLLIKSLFGRRVLKFRLFSMISIITFHNFFMSFLTFKDFRRAAVPFSLPFY